MNKKKIKNCKHCGKFINPEKAWFEYIPDTQFTIESIYFLCDDCHKKDRENYGMDEKSTS
jgi:NAD-dependent SIR2 family protein deacetylase